MKKAKVMFAAFFVVVLGQCHSRIMAQQEMMKKPAGKA